MRPACRLLGVTQRVRFLYRSTLRVSIGIPAECVAQPDVVTKRRQGADSPLDGLCASGPADVSTGPEVQMPSALTPQSRVRWMRTSASL
jgi:hypothetical protein